MTTSKLALGTAQLGLDYGISRPERMPGDEEVRTILAQARAAGIRTLDTAEGYGLSEVRLGALLEHPERCEIVTKFAVSPALASPEERVADLETRLQASLARLKVARLHGLMMHSAADLTAPGGAQIAAWLLDARNRGLAERVGVSVYDEADLEAVAKVLEPEIVQVPANLLDQRMLASPAVARLRSNGCQIHVRSTFLQGLLLSDVGLANPNFAPWREKLVALFAAIEAQGLTRLEACLAFARSLTWADRIVLGVHSAAQLRECLAAWEKAPRFDAAPFRTTDTGLIDPRRWPGSVPRTIPPFTAILQARMSSTRLPGKVLMPILGRPMLELQVERLKRCAYLGEIIIATSREHSDDPIEALATSLGLHCFRGSLADVLDRYYQAAVEARASYLVRVTGDCPLIDPVLVTRVIERLIEEQADYASNTNPPTFPDGLDVEAFPFRTLQKAWHECADPADREHVTPYIYRNPGRFRIASLTGTPNLSALRWTVDHPEDFAFVTMVFERLYPVKPDFGMADILALEERAA